MSYPILAPNSTWFTQGGTSVKRADITQINIVDSYTVTGNEISSWDASAAKDGSIMCYITGTVLTIAGNGSGKIALNADSSYLFADINKEDLFSRCTTINGLSLIDSSQATTLAHSFRQMTSVTSLEVDDWDISNVTSLQACFAACISLTSLNLSKWDVSNVETMYFMFASHADYGGDMVLTSVGDLSNWRTPKLTTTRCLFQLCSNLVSVDMSGWDMSKVTTTKWMFTKCTGLTAVIGTSNWVLSSCTDTSYMFYNCDLLAELDVSNWDMGKVTTMGSMFTTSSNSVASGVTALDTSKWDTSSCTDMSFMFWGRHRIKTLDVSNWDVSKVTNFDHMFAHSEITVEGTENWVTTSAVNMNGMFHRVKNNVIDVSNFDTSKVQFFGQMFEKCYWLNKIIGLENFNTSSGIDFAEMFAECETVRELDLSSFDTRKAKNGVTTSTNGGTSRTTQYIFNAMYNLRKITLGENFTFSGDGTSGNQKGTFPTPGEVYPIDGADGNWYTRHRVMYAPNAIPDKTADTYYASVDLVNDITYSIKNGTLIDIADAVRIKNNSEKRYLPSELGEAILALPDKNSGGVELPVLSNPASPAEILAGYEAIDSDGAVMVGTREEQSGGTESCLVTLNMYEGVIYYVDSTGNLMDVNAAGEQTIQVTKNSILVARAGVPISSSGGVNRVFWAIDTEEEDYAYVFFVTGNGSVSC